MLTSISAVKVVRKLSYNLKHGKKIEKEHLFCRESAPAMGAAGQLADEGWLCPTVTVTAPQTSTCPVFTGQAEL